MSKTLTAVIRMDQSRLLDREGMDTETAYKWAAALTIEDIKLGRPVTVEILVDNGFGETVVALAEYKDGETKLV